MPLVTVPQSASHLQSYCDARQSISLAVSGASLGQEQAMRCVRAWLCRRGYMPCTKH